MNECKPLFDGILGNVNGYQPVGKQAGPDCLLIVHRCTTAAT